METLTRKLLTEIKERHIHEGWYVTQLMKNSGNSFDQLTFTC